MDLTAPGVCGLHHACSAALHATPGGGSSLPATVQASNAPVHRRLLAGGNGPTGSLSRLLFKKHCLDSSNSPGTHRLITAHF